MLNKDIIDFITLFRKTLQQDKVSNFPLNPSRRNFLKLSGASLLTAVAAPACSHIDQFFDKDRHKINDEVFVIGAGLAGLSACYQLKKKGISYKLFEASSRYGGRIYTLKNHVDNSVTELGAQFVYEHYNETIKLAKELNVQLKEIPSPRTRNRLYFFSGKWLKEKEFLKIVHPLFKFLISIKLKHLPDGAISFEKINSKNLAELEVADQISMFDIVNQMKYQVSNEVQNYFVKMVENQFGLPLTQISIVDFFKVINLEETPSQHLPISKFIFENGTSDLVDTLYARVAGVIPEYRFKANYTLTEVISIQDYYHLVFNTPEGKFTLKAKYLILAIPPSQYKSVVGLSDLFQEHQRNAIEHLVMSDASKVCFDVEGPLFEVRKAPRMHEVFSDQQWGRGWCLDLSPSQFKMKLNFEIGYQKEQKIPMNVQSEICNALRSINKENKFLFDDSFLFHSWKTHKFINGKQAHFELGYGVKYSEIWQSPPTFGRIWIVGEHNGKNHVGTMESAIESSIRVVQDIVLQFSNQQDSILQF